jgi:hypothetical protein
MRFLAAILVGGLAAASLTPCLADPPASSAPATSQPATPAAPAAPAATSTTSQPATPAASSSAASAAKTPTATEQEQAALEKQLVNAGYTPEMHNGTKVFCRRDEEIGSRLGSRHKTCGTAEELAIIQQQTRDQFQAQQAASSVPASSGK